MSTTALMDDQATPANLAALRKAVSGDEKGLPHHSDRSLARFLRAKKTVDKAAVGMKTYDAFVAEKGLQSLTYADVQVAHSLGLVRCDPNVKDKEGRVIVWSMPGLLDHSKVQIEDLQRLVFYTLDWLTTTYEEVQFKGVVLCANWVGFTISMFRPALPKLILKTVQEVMPLRLKAIMHVNQSAIFDMVFSVIKPLMNEKLRSRLLFIGNPEKLREYIDKEQCMVEAGGTLPMPPESLKHYLIAGKNDTANPYPPRAAPSRQVVHM